MTSDKIPSAKRYTSDPAFSCPRAEWSWHPCVVHHGHAAVADNGRCVFCNIDPADELRDLVLKYIALREKDRARR